MIFLINEFSVNFYLVAGTLCNVCRNIVIAKLSHRNYSINSFNFKKIQANAVCLLMVKDGIKNELILKMCLSADFTVTTIFYIYSLLQHINVKLKGHVHILVQTHFSDCSIAAFLIGNHNLSIIFWVLSELQRLQFFAM